MPDRSSPPPRQEFPQILPAPGIVEHDPEAIWSSQLETARKALARASLGAGDLAAVGVTNQRETTILWDRQTGRAVAPAIVWQSRVSAGICERLRAEGLEETFRAKTGLVIDAYFSGTKITHLLDAYDGLRRRAERGEVLFGTVDSWLLWRLTGGRVHATDYSNASRTLLYNIHRLEWDDELLRILRVPRAMLPEVRGSSEVYGPTIDEWFGGPVAIAAVAGDQQAATFGQACFSPGMAKNTYGTGCFPLMNTGDSADRVAASHADHDRLGNRRQDHVLPGRFRVHRRSGRAVASRRFRGHRQLGGSETLAAQVADSGDVYFVPAFVGMGAPYWDPYARGAIHGITRGTTAAHLARAALESMAYQTRDVLEAMQKDAGIALAALKVDGGASVNHLLMQFQADVLGVPVCRPVVAETTALGAAYLAGLAVGYWQDLEELTRNWAVQCEYLPRMTAAQRDAKYGRWLKAVERSLRWTE